MTTSRIPLGDGGLAALWRWSNRLDRPLMYVLVLTAPTVLTGPLRWIAARPSRRYGFYLISAAVVAASWFTR